MYELYISDLSAFIEKGILFSFIIIFAAFTAVMDALKTKSILLMSLACECESPVNCFVSRKQNSIWNLVL